MVAVGDTLQIGKQLGAALCHVDHRSARVLAEEADPPAQTGVGRGPLLTYGLAANTAFASAVLPDWRGR